MLAESALHLPLDFLARPTPTIQSLAGGKIDLKVMNATESAVTLALEMPSCAAVKIGENNRSLTVPPGATGVAEFPVPSQAFPGEGVCTVPYRLTMGNGPAIAGQATADLRIQTRWWLVRRIQSGPKAAESGLDISREGQGDIDGLDEVAGGEAAVFKATALPKGWKRVTYGASLAFTAGEALPTRDSVLAAATRAEAPSERDAVVKFSHKGAGVFLNRVWVNHQVVYESQPVSKPGEVPKPTIKPFRLRKGMNTLVVELHSRDDKPVAPGQVDLEFLDPKRSEKQTDLVLDMEGK